MQRDAEQSPPAESASPAGASAALVLPGEPVPVRLMNTIWAERSGVHDALTTTGDLQAWLAATHPGRDQPEPGPGDLDRFRALRNALRRLAALVTGDTRTAAASATSGIGQAVAEVNHAAAQAPAWPQLAYQGGHLYTTAGGGTAPARRALSSIAQQAVGLLTGQDGITLRACNAPGCVLYFVRDHPRRQWCSAACGNRVRAARHYQRHRDQPSAC
jgi:predicted RNA-binding Zn ribbon-like protein